MANPQKENGYTSIANEILEHLFLAGINGSEYRILLVIIRKTYGFHKKKDKISLSQFEKNTSMNRPQVVNTIKSLLQKKIIIKENNEFIFNKNYDEWIVGKRGSMQKDTGMQKDTTASMQKHTESSMQKHTYKRNKETITKEKSGYNPLGADLIKLFEEINPYCKYYYSNTTQRKACDDLIEIYGFEEVSKVIPALSKTNKIPYFPSINTPLQLIQKYQQLKDKWQQKKVELQDKKNKYKVAF